MFLIDVVIRRDRPGLEDYSYQSSLGLGVYISLTQNIRSRPERVLDGSTAAESFTEISRYVCSKDHKRPREEPGRFHGNWILDVVLHVPLNGKVIRNI